MANVAAGLSAPAHPATPPTHSSLGHMPQAKWRFDDDVTVVFDDHVECFRRCLNFAGWVAIKA